MSFKGVVAILAAATVAVALAGCNTFKGVAKDIDSGATATEEAIKDVTSD